uniref:Uncharacterized protein n=1 Tax=Oryza brachyantha TaxID=4533 RepID=J3LL97_ORYBR
ECRDPSPHTGPPSSPRTAQRRHRRQNPTPRTQLSPPPAEDGKAAATHASSF